MKINKIKSNLDVGELIGEGDLELEESGEGERRTLLPGDTDADLPLLPAGVGERVLGIVLLLGDVEGDVGMGGDM